MASGAISGPAGTWLAGPPPGSSSPKAQPRHRARPWKSRQEPCYSFFACIDHLCLGLLTQPHLPHTHRLRKKPILWSIFLVALLIAEENENPKIN